MERKQVGAYAPSRSLDVMESPAPDHLEHDVTFYFSTGSTLLICQSSVPIFLTAATPQTSKQLACGVRIYIELHSGDEAEVAAALYLVKYKNKATKALLECRSCSPYKRCFLTPTNVFSTTHLHPLSLSQLTLTAY